MEPALFVQEKKEGGGLQVCLYTHKYTLSGCIAELQKNKCLFPGRDSWVAKGHGHGRR